MGLKEQLNNDLKTALKSGEQFRTGVLRLLSAALHNKEIEKHSRSASDVLTEDEIIQVLTSEAKKRKEAIGIFRKGERPDLADKEGEELLIIQNYLPAQLTDAETEKAVDEILKNTGVKDFGQAMKAVMKDLQGKADAKMIGDLVKKKLGLDG